MHEILSSLVVTWFQFVHDWGYAGVFLLMAMESSIIPVPSEVVMPPAAYWAAQGKMDFWLVVLAGTLGSYFGSAVSYVVARAVGYPVVARFGRYVWIGPDKLQMAQTWVEEFGVVGIFFSRLLPVIRHLISIPAGILKMPFGRFSAVTNAGAFLWCWILSWFGQKVIGDQPDLMTNPGVLVVALKEKLHWFVGAVLLLAALYALVVWYKRKRVRMSV